MDYTIKLGLRFNIIKNLLFITVLCVELSFGQWQQAKGPVGGDYRSYGWSDFFGSRWESTKIDDHTIYMRTDQGGLNYSTDNGGTWKTINRPFPEKYCFDFYVLNNQIFLIYTSITNSRSNSRLIVNMEGIYHTSNKGESWNCFQGDKTIYHRWETFMLGEVLYIHLGNEKTKFTKDGITWEYIEDPIDKMDLDRIIWLDKNIILIAKNKDQYIFDENHNSWKKMVTNPYLGKIQSIARIGKQLFASADAKGLFCSTDEGINWTRMENQLANEEIKYLIAEKEKLYVLDNKDHLLYSVDSGITWQQLNTDWLDNKLRNLFIMDDIIVLKTWHTSYATTDYGKTWKDLGFNICEIKNDGNNYFAATSHGLYISSDKGKSWNLSNSKLLRVNVRKLINKEGILFVTGDNGRISYSKDNGLTWSNIEKFNAYENSENNIFYDNGVILIGYSNRFYKSTDGGVTFIDLISKDKYQAETYYDSGSIICLVGNVIYKSSDLGKTWAEIKCNGEEFKKRRVHPYYENYFIVNGENMYFHCGIDNFYSLDGGINWCRSNSLPTFSKKRGEMYFYNNEVYYDNGVEIQYSNDNGVVWKPIYKPAPFIEIYSFVREKKNEVYVLTEKNGLKFSSNNGVTWLDISEGIPENIRLTTLCISGDYLVAGTLTDSIWRRPLSQIKELIKSKQKE